MHERLCRRWLALALIGSGAPFFAFACGNSANGSATATPSLSAARVLDRGPADVPAVALMFDVGDDAERTADILRTLRDERVRATFAVTGVWAELHRDLLFSISAEGHQIINATYEGRSWTGASTGDPPLDAQARRLALSRAEVTVYRYTSQSTRPYFRPPHDDVDESVLRDAAANGYGVAVQWTGSTDETSHADIATAAGSGAIIAMRTSDRDAGALGNLIASLRAQGFDFVTIGEMLP